MVALLLKPELSLQQKHYFNEFEIFVFQIQLPFLNKEKPSYYSKLDICIDKRNYNPTKMNLINVK
jgi:hypothetical protein